MHFQITSTKQMGNNTNKKDRKTISPTRRKLLRAAGAVVVFGGLQQTTIDIGRAFEGAKSLGRIHFVETSLTHKVPPHGQRASTDGFPSYFIDQSENRLLLTNLGRQEQIRGIRNQIADHKAIVHGQDFHPLPAVVFDSDSPRFLTTDATYSGGAIEQFLLAETYSNPSATIEAGADTTVTVSVEGETERLDPQTETTLTLDTREISYRVPVPLDSLETDNSTRNPTVAEREQAETTTVTPILKVRNNGKLDVYKNEEEQ